MINLRLALVLCLSSCASVDIYESVFTSADNPERGGIELEYRNSSDLRLCLTADYWPNSAGKINMGSDVMFLVVGAERYPVKDFNTGYCPESCATKVDPGETLKAFIRYEEFGLPIDLQGREKKLEFVPKVFACK